MSGQNRERARDFFGPLWAWLIIGAGLTMMASVYGLQSIGFARNVALAAFVLGAGITITMFTFLAVLGRGRSWQAFFWIFHTYDNDLIMGRKK